MNAQAAALKKKVPFDYTRYLRNDKMPHIWCPGCGHGIVLKSIIRAVEATGYSKDELCMVSGIGCSSRAPGYVDFNTLHTLHGRALAYATGLKLAKPKLKMIVVTGDGDALAIGGNHFIHACRRNIDMTVLVFSNSIYGMTGGQYSPKTPKGAMATTSPYGNIEPPFDCCQVAIASGATFVARGTSYHTQELEKIIHKGMMHNGMSIIEVIDSCPIYFGRKNRMRSASEMMKAIEKDGTVSVGMIDRLPPEKTEGKVLRGILYQAERPEYCGEYDKLIKKAKGL